MGGEERVFRDKGWGRGGEGVQGQAGVGGEGVQRQAGVRDWKGAGEEERKGQL